MNDKPKKKQVMRFSDDELQIIKNTFAENDDILIAIRKVMYQMALNALDLSLLETNLKGEVMKVVRKTFLPVIDANVPIRQQIDFWLTVPLNTLLPDIGTVHLKSVKKWIDYIEQQLKMIEEANYKNYQKGQKIKLKDLENIENKSDEEMYIDMLARNTIINHTEQQLDQLKGLAGLKTETPEQTIERLQKDSNK
jgi:hypothetical protein